MKAEEKAQAYDKALEKARTALEQTESAVTAGILKGIFPELEDTDNEREILYRILFELRGTVNDLNRKVNQLEKRIDDMSAAKTPASPYVPVNLAMEDALAEEYVEPDPNAEHLNLGELTKQMLERALERNNGNRKLAAQELGISDRTLYRRLKQYGIEP